MPLPGLMDQTFTGVLLLRMHQVGRGRWWNHGQTDLSLRKHPCPAEDQQVLVSALTLLSEAGEEPATAPILAAVSSWKGAVVPEGMSVLAGNPFSRGIQLLPGFEDPRERGTWMVLENLGTLTWESLHQEILG